MRLTDRAHLTWILQAGRQFVIYFTLNSRSDPRIELVGRLLCDGK